MHEAQIAIAASPRGWAQRLHRHIADHGGAQVRATVLHASDAIDETYEIFVVDDTTSFLSHHLLDQLHRRGRRVLGVYDPEDAHGKGELLDRGVDDVITRDAPAQEFLTAIQTLAASAPHGLAGGFVDDPEHDRALTEAARGRVTAVGGPSGGVGATEVAIGLAAAASRRGGSTVLVDADEAAPSLAQRLGLPLYPNIRAAIDAVEHRSGSLIDALIPVPGESFAALGGLSSAGSWSELRASESMDVVRALAGIRDEVILNVSHCIEDLHTSGGPRRYAQSRALLGMADTVVGVGALAPVGLARLLEWVVQVRLIAPAAPLHLMLNRAPGRGFRRAEAREEILRATDPASLSFAPEDPRVASAAWSGQVAGVGPFAKAMRALADLALPPLQVHRPLRMRRAGR